MNNEPSIVNHDNTDKMFGDIVRILRDTLDLEFIAEEDNRVVMMTDRSVLIEVFNVPGQGVRVDVRPLAMTFFLETPLNGDDFADATSQLVWAVGQASTIDLDELIFQSDELNGEEGVSV